MISQDPELIITLNLYMYILDEPMEHSRIGSLFPTRVRLFLFPLFVCIFFSSCKWNHSSANCPERPFLSLSLSLYSYLPIFFSFSLVLFKFSSVVNRRRFTKGKIYNDLNRSWIPADSMHRINESRSSIL